MTVVSIKQLMPGCLAVALMLALVSSAVAQEGSFQGRVVHSRVVELRAGVSGTLSLDGLAPGATVDAGHELGSLSASVYAGRLVSAEHGFQVAKMELEEAQKAFERDEVLFDEGSLSQVEFDRSALGLSRARAAVSRAGAELDTARSQASLSRLVAPFDAVVLDVAGVDGAYVNAAIEAPLVVSLAERGALAARVAVDPLSRRDLNIGDAARVFVENSELRGKISAIRYAGIESRWLVDVWLDAAANDIVAGMSARVEFP